MTVLHLYLKRIVTKTVLHTVPLLSVNTQSVTPKEKGVLRGVNLAGTVQVVSIHVARTAATIHVTNIMDIAQSTVKPSTSGIFAK